MNQLFFVSSIIIYEMLCNIDYLYAYNVLKMHSEDNVCARAFLFIYIFKKIGLFI